MERLAKRFKGIGEDISEVGTGPSGAEEWKFKGFRGGQCNGRCLKQRTKTLLQSSSLDGNLCDSSFYSEYKSSPNPMKENYLLSVFLGDIIGSPRLCHQLAKRGRGCDEATLSD
ncbi:hypothetical protein ANTPLA_LOCUS10082 [Anthophora plagiata]